MKLAVFLRLLIVTVGIVAYASAQLCDKWCRDKDGLYSCCHNGTSFTRHFSNSEGNVFNHPATPLPHPARPIRPSNLPVDAVSAPNFAVVPQYNPVKPTNLAVGPHLIAGRTKTTTTTTKPPTTTKKPKTNSCDGVDGFFYLPATKECFKFKTRINAETWPTSVAACASDGLALARPKDPIMLRRYLILIYGNNQLDVSVWLNAIYNDEANSYVWASNPAFPLLNTDPYWITNPPAVLDGGCLYLSATSSGGDKTGLGEENKPFSPRVCAQHAFKHLLCKKILV